MSVCVEWGLFNAEGLVEGDFWSEVEALRTKSLDYSEEDAEDLFADRVCLEHREHVEGECDEEDETDG